MAGYPVVAKFVKRFARVKAAVCDYAVYRSFNVQCLFHELGQELQLAVYARG